MAIMSRAGIRTYVDSSVFGGVYDDEFADASKRFFDSARGGRFHLLSSVLVSGEVADAPEPVRNLFDSVLAEAELIPVDDDALGLQAA